VSAPRDAGARPTLSRRRWLRAAGAVALWPSTSGTAAPVTTPTQRVLIIGAGWAGLAAAHRLRQRAADLQITLVDRDRQWRSLPLSNAWLTGFAADALPRIDLDTWCGARGVRFVAGEVAALHPDARAAEVGGARLAYDWLLLATGCTTDLSVWTEGDAAAAAELRQRWPAGYAATELDAVRRGLQAFSGGDLVLTVPPGPLRCPPAPYERAVLLAGWMRARGLPGRVVLLDATGGMPRYTRLFAERWRGLIEHRPHTTVRRVDPATRRILTDDDELRFAHALLLAPMHAGSLLAAAGLAGPASPAGAGPHAPWADVDPLTLRSRHDPRVFVAGDAVGHVSVLFGAYPKTAQVAADLGAAVADQIAAAALDQPPPPPALPTSQCHVWLQADPPEQLRLDAQHRLRGDGVIAQSVRQWDNPQPRGEDLAWARALLAQRLGVG
jgi:NADPH-dependent 2,4-dienoyl-CoA reductase/sulfur reductase-like enzyme